MDSKAFRKKYLLGLLTSPVTFYPVLVGVTSLLVGFAGNSAQLLFVGLACLVGGTGMFFQRLITGSEKLAKEAWAEIQEEEDEAREHALNELAEKLLEDGDSRTEDFLGDLRRLVRSFHEGKLERGLNVISANDIHSGVEELFQACITLLERSYTLWETARSLENRKARKAILDRREEVLQEIGASIEQLGILVSEINVLETGHGETSETARIRKELADRLDIARRVDERMREMRNNNFELEGKE